MARVRDWYKRNLLQSKNMETKMMGLQLLFFLPWSVDVIKKYGEMREVSVVG